MRWIVARSEPQREATAASFLGKSGYVVYLPRIREHRSNHGRRAVTTTPPLFPNYLFVRIELGWWDVRWCPGVSSLVMSGDGPARVPDGVVDGIRARERNGVVELPEPSRLRPGDSVRLTTGHLRGLVGLYSGQRGADRCGVLLACLGVAVVPASSVEAAS